MTKLKFEKRLRTEIVPEWRTKYIDYKGLKKRLRHIQQTRERELVNGSNFNSRPHSPDLELPIPRNNNRRFSAQSFQSPQRTFSMTSKASSFFHKLSTALVSIQKQQNLHAPPTQIKSLDTLMDQIDPEERLFFMALDKELAKIEAFYELKEKEASNRMNKLIQQYDILEEEYEKSYNKSRRNTKTFVKQGFEYLRYSSTNLETPEKHIFGFPEKQSMDHETAKKMIKKAVFEFYRSVDLLRKYCLLNYTGFAKLLKKYDKVSERNGYKIYMQKVTGFYSTKFSSVKNLLKEAEDFYADHFENGSRSRAMRKLRLPNKEHKTYYSSILRVGFYLGLALSFLSFTIYSLVSLDKDEDETTNSPLKPKLPLYGGFFLPIFLLLLLGFNMYAWTKFRINYKFIFELNPRDNLDFKQYFELPIIILLALSFTVCFNHFYKFSFISFISPIAFPIFFVIFVCAVIFNPFPILYYSARKWFVFSMARLLGSGMLRVEFRDFFLADGLTSLSYSLIMLQLFGHDNGDFNVSTSIFTPFLGSFPAFLRLLQCLKRYRDTHQIHHFINLLKYLSIILAIFMASLYNKASYTLHNEALHDEASYNKAKNATVIYQCLWLFTQAFASIYTFSWDVKMDWSLFKMHSVNYLLRDELGYEYRGFYYGAIVLNFFLRWSWVLIVIEPNKPIVVFFVAFGEMLRRWQWNFFRVENEHINNCIQNRAVKEVPLPFPIEDDIIMPEDFESVNIESDFDRTSSLTSWRKLFTASKVKGSTVDNLRDYEPRRQAPGYAYDNIYEESDDDSDGVDDYDVYDTRRSKRISVVRAEGTHGLSNAYASRSFLPIFE